MNRYTTTDVRGILLSQFANLAEEDRYPVSRALDFLDMWEPATYRAVMAYAIDGLRTGEQPEYARAIERTAELMNTYANHAPKRRKTKKKG